MRSVSQSFFRRSAVILIFAVLCTLLWGSAYPGVKIGYDLFHIPNDDVWGQLLFAGSRFSLAGLLVLAITLFTHKGQILPRREALPAILLLGFVQTTLEYVFFYIGLSHTTGVKGSILNATETFLAVILAHFVYSNDKLTRPKVLGCAVGFAGVVVINWGGGMDAHFTLTGEGFIMLAAASFAVGSLISKWAASLEDSMLVTGWQLLFGGALLAAAGLMGGARLTIPSPQALGLLLYLAALSAVAFTLWTLLIKYNPVSKISIYNFLTPVFGVLLSGIFLHESFLSVKNLSALILVCIGITLVNKAGEQPESLQTTA